MTETKEGNGFRLKAPSPLAGEGWGEGLNRRRFLIGSGTFALALPFARISLAADAPAQAETKIETPDNLFCVYVDRTTGTVIASKSFIDVNPEIKEGKNALVPYRAPTRNISVSNAPTLFKQDVTRFAIVDMPKRNAEVGAFSSLYDAYAPGEYTHHFLLNLADRELARELGDWALKNASEAQKAAALDLLHRIHTGYNGSLITGEPEKMAEAVRFYTGRELLRPMLFLGKPPTAGSLAVIPNTGIRLATAGDVRLALAGDGAVSGGVSVGISSNMSQAMSTAAQGATHGVSAVGAAVGASAGVGSKGGGNSSAGSGGAAGGSSGGGAGGAGGGTGNGGQGGNGKGGH